MTELLIISATVRGMSHSKALSATAKLSDDLGNRPKFLAMGGYRYADGELGSELSLGCSFENTMPNTLCEKYNQESYLIVHGDFHTEPETSLISRESGEWETIPLGKWVQVESIDGLDGWTIMPDGTIWTAK
jgi:hypothetical protein